MISNEPLTLRQGWVAKQWDDGYVDVRFGDGFDGDVEVVPRINSVGVRASTGDPVMVLCTYGAMVSLGAVLGARQLETTEDLRWRGTTTKGLFRRDDVVRSGGWLMAANEDTDTGPIVPVEFGTTLWRLAAPAYVLSHESATSLTFGHHYTVPADVVAAVAKVRVYIPEVTGHTYRVWWVDDDHGLRRPATPEFTVAATGWREFRLTRREVFAGETFSLAVTISGGAASKPLATVGGETYDDSTVTYNDTDVLYDPSGWVSLSNIAGSGFLYDGTTWEESSTCYGLDIAVATVSKSAEWDVLDAPDVPSDVPACLVRAATAQTTTSGNLATLNLDFIVSDPYDWYAPATNRVYPAERGMYQITAQAIFDGNTTGGRHVAIHYHSAYLNATFVLAQQTQQTISGSYMLPSLSVTAVTMMDPGDYIYATVLQDSGSPLDLYTDGNVFLPNSSRLAVVRLGEWI